MNVVSLVPFGHTCGYPQTCHTEDMLQKLKEPVHKCEVLSFKCMVYSVCYTVYVKI
jgi:hypothetical protein